MVITTFMGHILRLFRRWVDTEIQNLVKKIRLSLLELLFILLIIAQLLEQVFVISFNSLTTNLCRKYKSNIILRGLRAVSDFEYEFQLAGMNRKLNKDIETIFVMSDVENQIISSKFVKEIAELNGDIKKFTTKSTIKALKNKLVWKY